MTFFVPLTRRSLSFLLPLPGHSGSSFRYNPMLGNFLGIERPDGFVWGTRTKPALASYTRLYKVYDIVCKVLRDRRTWNGHLFDQVSLGFPLLVLKATRGLCFQCSIVSTVIRFGSIVLFWFRVKKPGFPLFHWCEHSGSLQLLIRNLRAKNIGGEIDCARPTF